MKLLQRLLAAALLLGSTSGALAAPPALPGALPWYNVSRPLDWTDLAGRAVLLDFFTPGCINCVHMVPVEEKLAARFGKQLVIIGVDAPKFTDSGTVPGLKDFIRVHHVTHPVVLDAHLDIWKQWHAFAWPTFVLVGPKGQTLGHFVGEQSFDDLAGPIKAALSDAPAVARLAPLPLAPLKVDTKGLNAPGGIAVSAQRVAISDSGHNRILLTDHDGNVKAIIGNSCAASHDGSYTQASFSRPHGLTFHAGKLYVADTQGQKLRVVDLVHQQVTTLAGSGKRAYVARGVFAANKASLNSPWDVQWLGNKLYVSMAGDHQLWRYDPSNQQIAPWAGSGREGLADGGLTSAKFAQPSGLAAAAGKLYVTDPESSALRRVDSAGGTVKTLVGQGLFDFGFKDGAAADALLQHNEGVALVGEQVYIADTFNNALRRLDMSSGRLSTVSTGLAHPQALALLSPTTLLVVESGGNRIDKVDLATGKVTRWPLKGVTDAVCTRAVP